MGDGRSVCVASAGSKSLTVIVLRDAQGPGLVSAYCRRGSKAWHMGGRVQLTDLFARSAGVAVAGCLLHDQNMTLAGRGAGRGVAIICTIAGNKSVTISLLLILFSMG